MDESPIQGAEQSVTAEVSASLPENSLVKRRQGRPRKVEPSVLPTPDQGSNILSMLEGIQSSVQSIADRVAKLEQDTSSMKTVRPSDDEVVVPKAAEVGKEDVLILAVRKILGQGDPAKCQFNVHTEPDAKGRTFMLVMIPPPHLREQEDDRRVKVLSYHEGVSGAEQYARIVYERCTAYASKNAIPYFQSMNS